MDRLTHFLQRFDLQAQVLHNGALRTPLTMPRSATEGVMHVVRSGRVSVQYGRARKPLEGPAVAFFARPVAHNISPSRDGEACVLSANVAFGLGDENPVLQGMPRLLVLEAGDLSDLKPLLMVLFAEAQGQRCGHATMMERLVEALVIRLLRLSIENRVVDVGVMAGLAEPRLAKALTAIHAAPDRHWDVESMAAVASMSRSRFAALFSEVVGTPAGEYLKRWRIGLAKRMLRAGRPIKLIAGDVGYGSAMAFGRAFRQVAGASPRQWLAHVRG